MGAVFLFLGLALLHETLAMTGALASLGDLLRPFFIIVVAVGMCDILLGVGIARRSRPVIAASIALYVLPSLGGLLFGGPLLGLFDAQVSDTSLHIDPVIYLLVAVSIFGIGGVFQLLGLLRAYRAIGVLRQRDASVPASTDLLAQQ